MGFNTVWIRLLIIEVALLAALFAPAAAMAAPPAPAAAAPNYPHTRLSAAAAQTITIPYSFEVIDFSGAEGPDLPAIDLGSVGFVNQAGSIAVTMFSLLDQYSFLGIFVIILASLGVIWWLYSIVSNRPSQATLNVTEGFSAVGGAYYDAQYRTLEQENAAIEAGGWLNDSRNQGYMLAKNTMSLNKSLMQSNRADAASYKRASRLLKKASRLRW